MHRRWPWYGEVALLFLAVAALMAMVGPLKGYDGQNVFHWHDVTLNAAIATLPLFKVSLTSVVATCLDQWKWIMFTRDD